jgi:hypothetical protein
MPAGKVMRTLKYPFASELAGWKYARTHQEVVHRRNQLVVVSVTT